MSSAPQAPVLQVESLRTEFNTEEGVVRAVADVSFTLDKGEVLGIVGESGSGKSVTAYSILGLVDPPGRIASGTVHLHGRDLLSLGEGELREVRGARIAMIFQDPMTSLQPLLRVGTQMVDAILAHRRLPVLQAREEALAALVKVGIASPKERLWAYPHQLSGGMRQRVAIAIAMLNKPDVIIADEPTTALDVTTQAQIIHELRALCLTEAMGLIWITHDLAVVSEIADRIAVMYAGSIVESGLVDDVIQRPLHPYTRGLIDSVPSRNRKVRRLPQIPGSIQSASTLLGCRFAPRCARASAQCHTPPELTEVPEARQVRCFHPLEMGNAAALV